MKQNAWIAGVGMTQFGKHMDRGLKSLAGEAITAAVADAGIERRTCRPPGWAMPPRR